MNPKVDDLVRRYKREGRNPLSMSVAAETVTTKQCTCHKFIRLHDGDCDVHGRVRKQLADQDTGNEITLSNFRVEYVKPDYSRGHSFEPRCAILADDAALGGVEVRVFDVPDPDESQREIAQFACEAMNDAGKYARLLEAAKLLLAMNNCNYDRDQMRRSGGFDALREAVEALEAERALAGTTD